MYNKGAKSGGGARGARAKMRLPSLARLTIAELRGEMINEVLAAIEYNDNDYEGVALATARWRALNKAHVRACDDATWAKFTHRLFPDSAPTIVDGGARVNFFALCDHERVQEYKSTNRLLSDHPEDQNVKKFVLAAVGVGGYQLGYASDDLRADRGVVLEAVHQTGMARQFASENLRADFDVVFAALFQSCDALKTRDWVFSQFNIR